MRSSVFKDFDAAEINKIIISFEAFELEDGDCIDS